MQSVAWGRGQDDELTESHADCAMFTLSWAAREFSSVIAATREISPLELDEEREPIEIDSLQMRL